MRKNVHRSHANTMLFYMRLEHLPRIPMNDFISLLFPYLSPLSCYSTRYLASGFSMLPWVHYLLSLGDLFYLNISIFQALKVPMKSFNDEVMCSCPRPFHSLDIKFTSEQNSCRMNFMVNKSGIYFGYRWLVGHYLIQMRTRT